MTLRAVFLFMRDNLGLTVGKYKCQLVRKPLPVMQDLGSVLFLFFPMVGKFHRAPVGDVTTFTFAEYSIEHSGSAEQADMPSPNAVVHVATALNHLTVLEFHEPVTTAAAGSSDFQIEREANKVFVKPVKSGAATDCSCGH